jgi:N-acetylglucosamine-6-phosphate deacetylase
MIVLSGGRIVLPDRILAGGSLLIHDHLIVDIRDEAARPAGAEVRDVTGCTLVPGFIDVHVHGVAGTDVLDDEGEGGADAVATVAARLPRYGVTGFCPTSVACDPDTLARFLTAVAGARATPNPDAAVVLPAHLESNFINPAWNGAQPAACLRRFGRAGPSEPGAFTGDDIVAVLRRAAASVGIVTIAPELDGGLALVADLVDRGHIVSIGHTGATYEEAQEAIRRGITHATHLFNRMTPLTHRAPGVVGAVLDAEAVAAEVICDGVHVHPRVVALLMRALPRTRVLAITDGTAAAGLPVGASARLGGRPIIAGERSATLEDGTMAGSVKTMDGAFRTLVQEVGVGVEAAAYACASAPAAQLGLTDRGVLEAGRRADVVVLGPDLAVRETWIAGRRVG